ncbi:hypothetical protein T439DRAFT_118805 [Meredithblackwellia eburnea MCA 4105]
MNPSTLFLSFFLFFFLRLFSNRPSSLLRNLLPSRPSASLPKPNCLPNSLLGKPSLFSVSTIQFRTCLPTSRTGSSSHSRLMSNALVSSRTLTSTMILAKRARKSQNKKRSPTSKLKMSTTRHLPSRRARRAPRCRSKRSSSRSTTRSQSRARRGNQSLSVSSSSLGRKVKNLSGWWRSLT